MKTNSTAQDLTLISCSAIKYQTGRPGAGHQKGGLYNSAFGSRQYFFFFFLLGKDDQQQS